MLRIYCSQCGGTVTVTENQRIALCDRCGNAVPVPRGYTALESSFLYAQQARMRRDFSSALSTYTNILKQHPENSAAWWGRAISRYEVEYQPIGGGEYRLVCHQAMLQSFAADPDVRKAFELGTEEERGIYMEETRKIAQLQKQVSSFASVTAPYDVMIVSDVRSRASMERAAAIKSALTAAGLRCLCPAMELHQEQRQAWEPVLFHGMNTASVMVYIAVGKQAFPEDELFDAERFLSLKAKDVRSASGSIRRLIVAYAALDEYEDIPDSVFDGADHRVSVENREFLPALCNLIREGDNGYADALHTESGSHNNYEYTNLIRQGRLALDNRSFRTAKETFEQVLSYNARESQAYWGLLLAANGCSNENELVEKGVLIREDGNYRSAVAFANERERQTIQNVAAAAEQTYQRRLAQEEEEERRIAEEERARELAKQEVERKHQALLKKKRRAKDRAIVLSVLLVIALAVGGIVYYQYDKVHGEQRRQYKTAMSYYEGGQYYEAMEIFEDLGDYQDSAYMLSVCESENLQKRFYGAQFNGESLDTRAGAVGTMLDLAEHFPEAQDYLDRWLQEGIDFYEQGRYRDAYDALRGFDISEPAYLDVWRIYQSQGLVTCSDNGSLIGITAETGALIKYGCDHLPIEDGGYRSVSLSDSGNSGGFVRADGTAYLVGDVTSVGDISGWTEMRSIQVTDSKAVGLREDGTLLCAVNGELAQNVLQFDIYADYVAAVRKDGTVYCSHPEMQALVTDRTDAAYIGITARYWDSPDFSVRLYIVNRESSMSVIGWHATNGMIEPGTDLPCGSVLAVVTDSEDVAVLTTSGKVFSTGWPITDKVAFDNTFLLELCDIMDVRIMPDRSGYGLNGMEEEEIAMRKAINGLDNIGICR